MCVQIQANVNVFLFFPFYHKKQCTIHSFACLFVLLTMYLPDLCILVQKKLIFFITTLYSLVCILHNIFI